MPITHVLCFNSTPFPHLPQGRNQQNFQRCDINACEKSSSCNCPSVNRQFLDFSNNKAFLSASVGFKSWSGTMNVMGWETHDVSLSLESLSGGGFWITDMLSVCRTGEDMVTPEGARQDTIRADGFGWYVANFSQLSRTSITTILTIHDLCLLSQV